MKNKTIFSGLNPLTIRMIGTGDYVRDQAMHLVDLFDLVQYDMEQSIKQNYEDTYK